MKKILSIVLSIVMLLMPVAGSAATPTELLDRAWNAGRAQNVNVSLDINSDLIAMLAGEEGQMVVDLLDALSFSVLTAPEGPWKAAMNLSGTEVLNIMGEFDGPNAYLASTLLGEDIIAVNEEETEIIVEYLLEQMVAAGMMTEDDLMQLEMALAMLPELIEELEMTEAIDLEAINTADLEALIADFESRIVPMADLTVPEGCAPAAEGYSFAVTAKDIAAFFEASYNLMKSVPGFMEGLAEGMGVTDPEAEIEQTIADMKAAAEEDTVEIPVVVMVDEAGEPVYFGADLTPTVMGAYDNSEFAAYSAPIMLEYIRMVSENGYVHTFSLTGDQDGLYAAFVLAIDLDNVLNQSVVFTTSEEEYNILNETKVPYVSSSALIGWFSEKQQDENAASEKGTITFSTSELYYDEEYTSSFNIDYTVDAAYDGQDTVCNTKVALSMDGMEIGALVIDTETCDLLPSLADQESAHVRIAQLIADSDVNDPESPLNQYVMSVSTSLMMNLMVILQSLPESVLSLVMGM